MKAFGFQSIVQLAYSWTLETKQVQRHKAHDATNYTLQYPKLR